MAGRMIGIRELKAKLSECVRQVKTGETIVITEHGHAVARMIPERASLQERLEALASAGVILWSGNRFKPGKPAGRVRGKRTVADLIIENRE